MHKGDTYTIAFAAVVCIVSSLLLSGTSALLKKRQDAMIELDRKINVLKAFQVPTLGENGKKIAASQVDRIFEEHISEIFIDAASGKVIEDTTPSEDFKKKLESKEILPLFLWKEGGETLKYAFPISGKGLWSTIYGYLALDKDLSTIVGITFYKHGETPGLGGEISTDAFQAQFKGKKIAENGQRVRFEVVKGSVKDKYPEGNTHAVDGISGATLTGKGINQFLNGDLEMYDNYFKGIRKG